MGGDNFFHPSSSDEEELSLGQDFPHQSVKSDVSSGYEEGLSPKLEKDSLINEETGSNAGEFTDGRRTSLAFEAAEKQKAKVYQQVLRSYEELQSWFERFEEAKSKILSYRPGSFAEKAVGKDLSDYDVPNVTSLLLVGPKGSGKSSLVNKISQVLEDNTFIAERGQVSYNPSNGAGTYFLHEYMVPRDSGSFCLYDTRSLSGDSSEDLKMLSRWMIEGVRHGELVKRKSDSVNLKAALKHKARRSCPSSQVRAVNFVIFVVDGLSVLESMDGVDDNKKRYSEMIATSFNDPMLSFKDDKPVVVVTHGDLLSLSDRVRARVYLGELLGVPPTSQIFDIPENNDSVTSMAIVEMLLYCLERSDRNLPPKPLLVSKLLRGEYMRGSAPLAFLFLWIVLIAFQFTCLSIHQARAAIPLRPMKVDWPSIRHMWLG